MSDHPTLPVLAQYRKRTLFPADFLEVHRHILTCAACYETCHSPQQFKEDYESLRAALLPQPEETPYHLSPDEASRYLARRLDQIDLEIVESHLEFCDTCTAKVRRLKEEASLVASQTSRDDTRRSIRASAPQRVLSSSTPAPHRMRWGRAAALAAVVCVMLGVTLLLGSKLFKRSEVVVAPVPEAVNDGQGVGGANSSPNLGEQESARDRSAGTENAAAAKDETRPEIAAARELLVLHDQGRRLALDEKGNLSGADGLAPDLQQSIKRMLSSGRVPRAAYAAELKGSRSTLLGEAENEGSFRLLSPVGKVVSGNRPTFIWQPLAGASSYTVTVVDARLNEVMTSEPLTTTNWRAAKPLSSGGTYSWQVSAFKDGKQIVSPVLPSPPARFKILERERVRQLEQARKAYANSHLALAVLYAEAGLRDEAESELRALLKANPQSGVVRNLLRDIKR